MNLYDTIFLLSLRARSCRFIELLSGTLRTHLFLNSPENSCSPISAMTPRKNRNKTRTSLKSFNERSSVFTIARRPAKYMNETYCPNWVHETWKRLGEVYRINVEKWNSFLERLSSSGCSIETQHNANHDLSLGHEFVQV